MGNKEISNYLNSKKIKPPTGKEYTRQLIGMYFYKSRKIERRLKHLELKVTKIQFDLLICKLFGIKRPKMLKKNEKNAR